MTADNVVQLGFDTATLVRWQAYVQRYRTGEWRAPIFRDMVLSDARQLGPGLTFLDIGCGRGFDGDLSLQEDLARAAGRYLGIEPDPTIAQGAHFTQVQRCSFEDASLAASSIDIAFAVMVVEHLSQPQRFWDKVWEVLVPGGVFWAFTVDARHWFCRVSLWMQRLKLKNAYLDWLMGRRGDERYEDYPVFYRCNAPNPVRRLAVNFSSVEFVNFSREGQCDPLFPPALHGLSHALDRRRIRGGRPGTLLAIRAVK